MLLELLQLLHGALVRLDGCFFSAAAVTQNWSLGIFQGLLLLAQPAYLMRSVILVEIRRIEPTLLVKLLEQVAHMRLKEHKFVQSGPELRILRGSIILDQNQNAL